LGTLDTKGEEHAFLAEQIRHQGCEVLLIDVGTGAPPLLEPDISRDQIAQLAGIDLSAVTRRRDRGEAMAAMVKAAPRMLARLHEQGRIDGVIALGGGGGTAIAAAAMRVLPIGFPKLIVSTMASGNTAHYLGTKDIAMIPSVVDIQGLNRVSRLIFSRAAGAIVGMVRAEGDIDSGKPLIVASMFGNTTPCVQHAKKVMEDAGYEVLVFAATGTGGRAMEDLIDSGLVAGVLDITTTELADELVGGVLSAGPDRLLAAARAEVPSIVVPGCLDMVNFGERDSVPLGFVGRTFYQHNPQVTLMRTTPAECRELGQRLAQAVNQYTAPATVLVPLRAISVISAAGQAFDDPVADAALHQSLRSCLRPGIGLEFHDLAINDSAFAELCAQRLLANIERHRAMPEAGFSSGQPGS
jgi:uncharacterized protein (UPF0261 family)